MEIKNLDLQNQIDELRDMIYPVGSIYFSTNSANPSTIWGGTWTQIKGRFLIGVDQTGEDRYWNTSKLIGGDIWLSLDESNLPPHTHQVVGTIDSSGEHSHALATANGQGNIEWGYSFLYDNNSASRNAGAFSGDDGKHTHPINMTSKSTGQGQEKFFVPPYYSVYIWERTA